MFRYLPALDGLRGLAILLVMAEHLGIPGFPNGGRVGVLIFFVLSGFLITSLLIEERERTGRIDLRAFYVRRARRLLPALALLLIVVLVTSRGEALGSVLWAASYMAFWAGSENLGPLYHTWTLSAEEQFYLLWPVGLIAYFGGWRWVFWPVLAAILALLPVTAGSLLAGCALAFVVKRWTLHLRLTVPAAVVLVLLAMIPGDAARSAVVWGAVAVSVVAIASAATTGSRTLSVWPLTGTGRISYGLYLWHAPISWVLWPLLPFPASALISGALSFTAAGLSWVFVERSLRRKLPDRHDDAAGAVAEDKHLPAGLGHLHLKLERARGGTVHGVKRP